MKILSNRGWSAANADSSETMEPLHPNAVKELELTNGPTSGTPEAASLEDTMGYNYRQGIGEVMYAYVTTRPDVGPAVATLAKFSAHPATCHYLALK